MQQLRLIFKTDKQFTQLNTIKTRIQENRARDLNRQFSKKDIQMVKRQMKGCSLLLK